MNSLLDCKLVGTLFVITLLSGCASVQEVSTAKKEGLGKTYPISTDTCGKVVKKVLGSVHAKIDDARSTKTSIFASSKESILSMGTVYGVWCDETVKNNTKITILSERKARFQATTDMTEEKFHEEVANELKTFKLHERM